jgi:leucine dehydrogenase
VQVFDTAVGDGHETVVFCHDRTSGLRAVVAIHSTALGPALGGTRMRPYASEDDAVTDVLRLSKGMTYKNATAGLALGGGKGVILGDPHADKTPALLAAYGRAIDRLGGAYLTAEDVGTTQADMDALKAVTPYVTGATGGSGDPSPATALGVFHAIDATLRFLGDDGVAGRHVVVLGVGKVGADLVRHLVGAGATVTVSDLDPVRVADIGQETGAAIVGVDEAHRVPCDVFSPCALGGLLNEVTIPQLVCRAVVGAANNQLAVPEDGDRLAARGIVYAPDYVVNAGGVINIFDELQPGGYRPERAHRAVEAVATNLTAVLEVAQADGITPAEAADRVAERRLGLL